MTAADPSNLRHVQTRLHIENLWTRMFSAIPTESNSFVGTYADPNMSTAFENISNFDEMLCIMDDFGGLLESPSDSFTTSSLSAIDQQHSSPFP